MYYKQYKQQNDFRENWREREERSVVTLKHYQADNKNSNWENFMRCL